MMLWWCFSENFLHFVATFLLILARISNNACTKRWIKSSPEYPRFLATTMGGRMAVGRFGEAKTVSRWWFLFFPKHFQVFYVCFFFGKDVYRCLNVLNAKKSTNLTPVFFGIICCILGKDIEGGWDLMKSTGWLFSFGALGGGSMVMLNTESCKIPCWELTYTLSKALLKMIFLFPRWYMLVSWKVMWLTKSLWLFDEASDSHQAQRQCCTMITKIPQPTIAHAKVGSGRCAGQIADCGEGTTKSWNWMEIP